MVVREVNTVDVITNCLKVFWVWREDMSETESTQTTIKPTWPSLLLLIIETTNFLHQSLKPTGGECVLAHPCSRKTPWLSSYTWSFQSVKGGVFKHSLQGVFSHFYNPEKKQSYIVLKSWIVFLGVWLYCKHLKTTKQWYSYRPSTWGLGFWTSRYICMCMGVCLCILYRYLTTKHCAPLDNTYWKFLISKYTQHNKTQLAFVEQSETK